MIGPDARLTLVTLGVADLDRGIAFYETLGFRRKVLAAEGVGFFQAGTCAFAVFPLDDLAKDARVAAVDGPSAFRGVALAWNCASQADVDVVIERALAAGATITRSPQETFWGGYAGYFADPDGHLWEVAHNPGFPLSDDGRLLLPDWPQPSVAGARPAERRDHGVRRQRLMPGMCFIREGGNRKLSRWRWSAGGDAAARRCGSSARKHRRTRG